MSASPQTVRRDSTKRVDLLLPNALIAATPPGVFNAGATLRTNGFSQLQVLITYTPSALGQSLEFEIETSHDGQVWYQDGYESLAGLISTLSPLTRVWGAVAVAVAQRFRLSFPVAEQFTRINFREAGVAGSSLQIDTVGGDQA